MTDDILMSIRPRFAAAILSGAKSHELRRRFLAGATGTRVFVYASSPVCRVVGYFSVQAVDTMPTWLVARRRRRATTLSAEEIYGYLEGLRHGTLIEVAEPTTFDKPIALAVLREWGLEPPQSYRYLSADIVERIERLTASAGSPTESGGRSVEVGGIVVGGRQELATV